MGTELDGDSPILAQSLIRSSDRVCYTSYAGQDNTSDEEMSGDGKRGSVGALQLLEDQPSLNKGHQTRCNIFFLVLLPPKYTSLHDGCETNGNVPLLIFPPPLYFRTSCFVLTVSNRQYTQALAMTSRRMKKMKKKKKKKK